MGHRRDPPAQGRAGAKFGDPETLVPSLTWNGEALILLAQGPDQEAYIFAARPDGKVLTPLDPSIDGSPPVQSAKLRCEGSRPVMTYHWKGGRITIDPGRSGAARRLDGFVPLPEARGAVLWVGEVAVDEDLRRWRCQGGATAKMVPVP